MMLGKVMIAVMLVEKEMRRELPRLPGASLVPASKEARRALRMPAARILVLGSQVHEEDGEVDVPGLAFGRIWRMWPCRKA